MRMRCRSLIGPLQRDIGDWIGRDPPRPQSQQKLPLSIITEAAVFGKGTQNKSNSVLPQKWEYNI